MSEEDEMDPAESEPVQATPVKRTRRKPKQTAIASRLTQYEVMERRKQVENLRLRGLSVTAIGKLLNISPSQVSKDLKAVRADNITAVEEFNKAELIAEVRGRWAEVEERAWSAYHRASEVGDQIKALNLVRVTQSDKIKAHIDVGLIQKDSIAVEVRHTHQLDWSDEMKQRVARALLEQSLTPQLPEPTLEIIDLPDEDSVETRTLDDDEDADDGS